MSGDSKVENVNVESVDNALIDEISAMGGDALGGDDPQPSMAANDIPLDAPIAMVWQMAFSIAAAKGGAHWALSNDEIAGLVAATKAVVAKYMSGRELSPEVALIITVAMITAPRFVMTMTQKKTDDDAKASKENAGEEHY